MKHLVIISPTLSEIRNSLCCDVKVFLTLCFLLLKDDANMTALFSDLFPRHLFYVAFTDACQTGKQKRSPEDRIFALRSGHSPDLFKGQVNSFNLNSLEPLNTAQWVVRDYLLFKRLIDTGSEFIEVLDL